MSEITKDTPYLPPEQEAIRARCFHPSGSFVEFRKEEVEQSIPSRFEQMVRKYPDQVAVKTRNYTLTYDALNKAGNRVAHAILNACGEGNEPIALLLDKDAPMAAAILGVLKAGKIYVPLDPSHPPARISYIREDTYTRLVLTDNKNVAAARTLAQGGCELLNMEELNSRFSPENPAVNISADSLAYVRYTSGSTGQPKGVMENHRIFLHVIMRQTNAFHICADDRLIFLGSWGKHIFRGLLNGAAVYPAYVKEEGVAHLGKWLAEEEITIYHSVPSVFRHFIDTLTGIETFPSLRIVRLAGEPVAGKDIELFKKHFPPKCVLVNELGCTEAGTIAHYLIDKETRITTNTVPVGNAVEDIKILLLDGGKRVGFDEIGEIAVQSRYLSPGYWRRPALTRAAFLPDPEGGDERIYLPGDLGRMEPDGCLFHLGRKDFQVKVRGYRIEVGEIETALLEHPAIKEVAVVGREVQTGDKRLVAYFVPTGQPAATVRELRNFLKDRLPDYMIPSAFVTLRAFPLTPNGKVDRLALPAPEGTRPELDIPFAAPRTPIEEELAGIWAEVLGLDQVGIYDNFLDLGGDSLLATQVISRVIPAFGVELPVKSLLQAPTVAEMAVVIMGNQTGKVGQEDLTRLLGQLESLSDEEARRLLAAETASRMIGDRHE